MKQKQLARGGLELVLLIFRTKIGGKFSAGQKRTKKENKGQKWDKKGQKLESVWNKSVGYRNP